MSTKIQWTEETWNPVAGCSVVSPGCTNCYAMRRQAPRLAANPQTPQYHGTIQKTKAGAVWTGKIGFAGDTTFLKPLRTKRPTMWFVNSMSDLFHENVPDEVIDRVFAIMALCPQHTFQILTKRARGMMEYMTTARARDDVIKQMYQLGATFAAIPWPLPNVWMGVSVEDQIRADQRIPELLATPAAIRFISAEPLLGPVNLRSIWPNSTECWDALDGERWYSGAGSINSVTRRGKPRLDWVIVGGESGKGARPMHPHWARDLRDQCAAAGVPYFFKQWGEYLGGEVQDHGDSVWFEAASRIRQSRYIQNGDTFDWFDPDKAPDGPMWLKTGIKAAGRLLDGVEHNAMPEVQS